MRRSNLFPLLPALALLAAMASAEVRLEFSGDLPISGGAGFRELRARACNETPSASLLKGWRFKTPSFGAWKTIYYPNPAVTGAGPFEYTQEVPGYDENLAAGQCTPAPAQYYSPVPEGADANPFDPQLLIKTGSCTEAEPVRDAAPVSCAEIPAFLAGPAYHDPGHCILDTLGTGGADNAGSLTASHFGQTQIQAAVPPQDLLVYGWEMRWDPASLGGPFYMMALAMGQEYLGMNRQWLQTIAGKESNFGYVAKAFPERGSISEWANGNVDWDGTWLPWQVVTAYYANLIHSYPDYFPKHACAAGFQGPMLADSCVGGWENAIAYYARTPGLRPTKTGPNSPQLANAVFSVSLAYYWIYDGLWRSTDLCYADAVIRGKDKRVALGGIIPLYADGIYSDVTALKARNLKDTPEAFHTIKPGPSAEYRDNVFYMLDAFHKANDNSTACGGTVPIYDAAIPWDDVQRFYFGGSVAPGTPEVQGDGGLLLHFSLSLPERRLLLADLRCAFDRLKGRAPSTAGREAVSYRYDWLTVMRAAKGRLPLQRKPPSQAEWNNWIKERSKDPQTCAGGKRDADFPGLSILSPAPGGALAPGDTVDFASLDAGDPDKLRGEWTLNRTWSLWRDAVRIAPGRFRFRAPCGNADFAKPGALDTLWVRVTDGCGNTTAGSRVFRSGEGACPRDTVAIPGDSTVIPRDTVPSKVPPKDSLQPKDPPKEIPKDTVRPIDTTASLPGPIDLFVTFPGGSMENAQPSAGGAQVDGRILLAVDKDGAPMPGPGTDRCAGCIAGDGRRFAGPVFHILTPGPVEYSFHLYSTLGESMAGGEGKVTRADLARLGKEGGTSGRFLARIIWTGRTSRGGRAGTGAYVLKAVVRPIAEIASPPLLPVRKKVVFGLLRG